MSKEKQLLVTKTSATEVMGNLAGDDLTGFHHKYFVQVPHKLLRCANLSHQAKMILFDIIGYMGKNSYGFPPIEDLGFDCGMTHTTVRKFIEELEEKKILMLMA